MLRSGQMMQLVVVAMLGFAVIVVHSADMNVGGGEFDAFDALKTKTFRGSIGTSSPVFGLRPMR